VKRQPRIEAVAAKRPYRILISWSDGGHDLVGIGCLVRSLRGLAPLRDREMFKKVRVKEWGWAIEWTHSGGELDIGAETLWRLALEQKGEAMSAEQFREWRARHKLSHDQAARALGLSRRTVIYYDQGQRPIPKTVWLATIGIDARRRRRSKVADGALREWS